MPRILVCFLVEFDLLFAFGVLSCRILDFASLFINRAAIGGCDSRSARDLFIFLVLSVTRRRPLLGQALIGTLNHATCTVQFHYVTNKSDRAIKYSLC